MKKEDRGSVRVCCVKLLLVMCYTVLSSCLFTFFFFSDQNTREKEKIYIFFFHTSREGEKRCYSNVPCWFMKLFYVDCMFADFFILLFFPLEVLQ